MAFTAPSLPKVCAAPAPLTKAPRTTKIPQIIAAVVKRTMRLPTAVPKTLAASFAPSDQPRKRPLLKKMRTDGSSKIKLYKEKIILNQGVIESLFAINGKVNPELDGCLNSTKSLQFNKI